MLGHRVAQRLVAAVLVDRIAQRRQTWRAQHQAGGRVVGDQRHHLVTGDERLDVAGLRLGERAGAAVGLDRWVARVCTRAAPEAAVVAVRVHAVLGQSRGRRAVAGFGIVRKAAVLAPVLAPGRGSAHQVGRVVDGLVAALVGRAGGAARGLEAVRVDDRHDDVAAVPHDVGGARVTGLEAVDQLVGPLHRVLARGPLARMVDAHVQERRLAVVCIDVGRDLDAHHVLAEPRLIRQREQADETRVRVGQILQLGVVVGQRAIRGAAAGETGRGLGRAALGHPLPVALCDQVLDQHPPVQAGLEQRGLVVGPVQYDAQALRASVLGHVEPERQQLVLVRGRGREHAHERRRVALRQLQRAVAQPGVLQGGGDGRRATRAAAGLHAERPGCGRVSDRDLLGVGGRVGGDRAAGCVEHSDVPVASMTGELDRHLARAGDVHAAGGHARPAGTVREMAAGLVGAGRGGEGAVEHGGGHVQQLGAPCHPTAGNAGGEYDREEE